jgi:hypothetical protein
VSVPRTLFEGTFVHAFEEDGPEGAVYRAEGHGVSRSRRPRERLSFGEDGSVRLLVGGPDDRLQEVKGRWTDEAGEIRVATEPTPAVPRAASHLSVRILPDGRLLVS